jgi:DNA-binding transcriptional LysR family regulator
MAFLLMANAIRMIGGIILELLQLKYFKRVAETGKIKSAAESLYISPPALSASISRLERELGVKLFDRTNNSISLNKQGEIFLHYVNHLLTTLENAKLEVLQSLERETERVSIAATSSNIWLDMFCAFTLEYPHITISHSSIALPQVCDGNFPLKYDFLLASQGDLEGENLESAELFEDQLAVMVYPDHPFASRSSVHLREIIDETVFAPIAEQSLRRMLDELFKLAGLSPKGITEGSYMVRRSMVLAKRGISISTMQSSKAESDPCLRYIPIETPYHRWKQLLLWHKDKDMTNAAMLFRDFTIDYYRK